MLPAYGPLCLFPNLQSPFYCSTELIVTEGSFIMGEYKLVRDIDTDGYADQAYPDTPIHPVTRGEAAPFDATA